MVNKPNSSEPIATLQALLRDAEAALLPLQEELDARQKQIKALKRAIAEYEDAPKDDFRLKEQTPSVNVGPAERARMVLLARRKPCLISDIVDSIYDENPNYQRMPQGRVYIERSITRACTGGTILYFTQDRIGLPEHAVDKSFKHEVDWPKIRKRFKPHHLQREKLKDLLPSEILKKLFSTTETNR